MTDPDPFDRLLGAWLTEATHPDVDAVVAGSVTFEWLEGRRFLLMRSSHEHESFPDALGVLGAAEVDGPLVMEYFDSRGVRRTYGVSLGADVLRFWREAPGFDQRFSAELGRGTFHGLWQLARTPGNWQDDLRVTYRRPDLDG